MSDEISYETTDGAALYELYKQGDFLAGYWYAQLVFEGRFKSEPVEGITKKAQKLQAKIEAELAVVAGAEGKNLECMKLAADMYFSGRREPGAFGSMIFSPQYLKSKIWYTALLDLDLPNATRGLFLFRIGLLGLLLTNNVSEETLKYWNKAKDIECPGGDFATAKLAQYHYDSKEFSKAIPLLESVYVNCPYSAVTLALCYQYGYGVSQDISKSEFGGRLQARSSPI